MLILWCLGAASLLSAITFAHLSFVQYLRAQANRIEGMDKDPVGLFDDMRFHFDEGNYTEQGLLHRKKYYSYTLYASISVFALIFTIVVGMFF